MQTHAPDPKPLGRMVRIFARLAVAPLGGFAAPPPTLMEAVRTLDEPRPPADRPPAREAQPSAPIRWVGLSAVR